MYGNRTKRNGSKKRRKEKVQNENDAVRNKHIMIQNRNEKKYIYTSKRVAGKTTDKPSRESKTIKQKKTTRQEQTKKHSTYYMKIQITTRDYDNDAENRKNKKQEGKIFYTTSNSAREENMRTQHIKEAKETREQ